MKKDIGYSKISSGVVQVPLCAGAVSGSPTNQQQGYGADMQSLDHGQWRAQTFWRVGAEDVSIGDMWNICLPY